MILTLIGILKWDLISNISIELKRGYIKENPMLLTMKLRIILWKMKYLHAIQNPTLLTMELTTQFIIAIIQIIGPYIHPLGHGINLKPCKMHVNTP